MLTSEELKNYWELVEQVQKLEKRNPLLEYSGYLRDTASTSTLQTSVPEEINPSDEIKRIENLTSSLYQGIIEANNEIVKLQTSFKKQESENNNIIQGIKDDNDKLRKEIDNGKYGLIEALAVLVGFFTLISVNVNIFTKVEYLSSAIWFMFLMTICLVIALLIFSMILRNEFSKWKIGTAGVLIGFMILSFSIPMAYKPLDIVLNQKIVPTPTIMLIPTSTPIPTDMPTLIPNPTASISARPS